MIVDSLRNALRYSSRRRFKTEETEDALRNHRQD